MAIQSVKSHADFLEKIKGKETSYLLIYKSGSEKSDCALQNMQNVTSKLEDIDIFSVDVNEVNDLHQNYSITSAPSLLEFQNGTYMNVVKGCHDESYYKALFENLVFIAKAKKEGKTLKNVVVYTTPTCSWCNTLKSYLRKNSIPFKEVDVSKDESAAQRMVQKSGQQGVPQTEINGRIVVGFDKTKINQLLEIKD
ncbi:MAG: NrdH-redoxin [Chloroflexia bacterium]|nr:NrdH-redoxin [Chloroflexia bacterium]